MTDTERAEIYRKGIVCQECIRYERCAAETRNTGLKRIFGSECKKDLKAVIESGELDRLIVGVKHSIDNGMDVSDADLKNIQRLREDIRAVAGHFGQNFKIKEEHKENLMLKNPIKDGNYLPKDLCTIDRFGEADDYDSCDEYCKERCENNCEECAIQACFNKLAEYENTGLSPEGMKEISRLYVEKCKELVSAAEEVEKYEAIGTIEECQKSVNMRKQVTEIVNRQLIAGKNNYKEIYDCFYEIVRVVQDNY